MEAGYSTGLKRTPSFRKTEIILIHLALFHLGRFFELAGKMDLDDYRELDCEPVDIHKPLWLHEKAVKLLTGKILELFTGRKPSELAKDMSLELTR